ncbi:nitrate- and nitrite sensing domain-containing protein [Candidatus Halobeggiatoa sp. HSG11]|nr:nitrate- and nitrite sensing domain-containing protein [Candidatus Halobeggiatoa sp. HSG11]
MLKNINISHKLVLMILLPIMGLIYFTTAITLEKLATVEQMELLQELSVLAVKSSSLIHELQKERGMSAGFIGSKGNNFSQELQKQRHLTDIAIKKINKYFNGNTFDTEITNNLATIFSALKVITSKRKLIDKLEISTESEMLYYTKIIDTLLTGINYLSKKITNPELYNKVLAYANLLQAKEKAGIERATLNNVFSRNEGYFASGMYNKFILLVGLQYIYIKEFFIFATPGQQEIYNQIIQGKTIVEVERIRKRVINKQLKQKIIADLQIHLGYGGLIHHFKNYVLRGDQKYIDAFHEQYQNAYLIMAKYKQLSNISVNEIENIEIVKETFDRYNLYLSVTIDLKSRNKKIGEIDKIVKIDDMPAIMALAELRYSSHLHVEPETWWEMATNRIELFKKVENYIASDLKLSANILKRNAQSVFFSSLVITGITILLTLFLSIFFARGITKPLHILVDAANKISFGKRDNIYINKHSGDEIGTLSSAMNQMLTSIRSSESLLIQRNELIRNVFGRYLSDEVVNTLLETESGLTMGGERREITILTSDLRGFTAQSNKLPSEQVIKILNFYLETVGEIIAEYNGTINEFLGDGILVFFGAPILREDDPERAIACAIAMQLAMTTVNKKLQKWGFDALEMGIGINTAEVVVGNIGSEKRTKYSAIGNGVNLAYRIESYTVGGQIFISESTLRKTSDIVKVATEKQVNPKGIKQTIKIYEVEGIEGKYNLHLHKKEVELFPLKEEVLLQYAILKDKHVGKQIFNARIVKLSSTRAVIYCETIQIPKLLSNLKINFINISDEDVYAKVLSHGTEGLYIHFTSLSLGLKQQLLDKINN